MIITICTEHGRAKAYAQNSSIYGACAHTRIRHNGDELNAILSATHQAYILVHNAIKKNRTDRFDTRW